MNPPRCSEGIELHARHVLTLLGMVVNIIEGGGGIHDYLLINIALTLTMNKCTYELRNCEGDGYEHNLHLLLISH